ncbi:MAG: diadenylate cyclase CdaA, partial [Clostridiales Family XIII bacterium]|nr:diadenylate cyclase CdaA [Clostridiales Family XIII bacterium]
AIAAVIIFQPEVRGALEYVGRGKFRSTFLSRDRQKAKMVVNNIIGAVEYLSTNKVGSIIVIEREVALGDFVETGVVLNSDISKELIKNVFFNKAPLHDGAMIIKKDKIVAAGCFLPLSNSSRLSKELGTRHRAALGIAEKSDCLAIVTSEERGTISMAENSVFDGYLELKEVEKKLYDIYIGDVNKKKGLVGLKERVFPSKK